MRTIAVDRITEFAIAAFLWAFRIAVILLVVVGSFLTLSSGKYSWETWSSLIVSGLSTGSIYALIALGYTMVYGILRMINFAHGEIFMGGAFAGYFVATLFASAGFLDQGPLPALFAVAVMIVVAAAFSTLLALFLQYPFRGFFGSGFYVYPDVSVLAQRVPIDFLRLRWVDVLVVVSAVVMMTGLYLFVMRTRMGTAIRAVSEDKSTAQLMGIDVNRAIVTTFAVGAAMAGAAGVLYALLFRQVFFFTGFVPGIKAFTAAVLGGIGNVPGAMLGGLFLGQVEAIGPTLFLDGLNVPSPNQLKDVIAFTLLVLVLVFRPSGILGERI